MPEPAVQSQSVPVVSSQLQSQPNLNRTTAIGFDPQNVATEDVHQVLVPGFEAMDRGVKEFFSDIQVPTKDGLKPLTVRVAGGDKTILYWKQDLTTGRVKLPICSVNRTGLRGNPERRTPAEAAPHFYRRFADSDKTRMVVSPREFSVLIDYTLSIWAERKRDMEFIIYQMITRFNPVAQWTVEDEFMVGDITATWEGTTDNSDIDIDANQLAKVRYDTEIKIEGWLPLSGRIVPTVLGRVQTLDELDTREFLGVIKSSPRGI